MNYKSHKELWNLEALVNEYNIENPLLTWPEVYLIEKAKTFLREPVTDILCVGVGGGREVLPLHNEFKTALIYANDIAAKMIEKAEKNFEQWDIASQTKTLVCPVSEIEIDVPAFQLITCFNNVSSFILPHKNREQSFKKMYELTTVNGVIIGMVHHIYSTPLRTVYFLFRWAVSPLLKSSYGDKKVGRTNQKYYAHYFSKKELNALLQNAGYAQVHILSLEAYYQLTGRKYNRRKGWNNLIFLGVKQ